MAHPVSRISPAGAAEAIHVDLEGPNQSVNLPCRTAARPGCLEHHLPFADRLRQAREFNLGGEPLAFACEDKHVAASLPHTEFQAVGAAYRNWER